VNKYRKVLVLLSIRVENNIRTYIGSSSKWIINGGFII
jgi:hypothetical protein